MSNSSNGAAGVLSFFIPGLGQIYRGHVIRGLMWMVLVVAGYVAFIIPGVLLHILCIMFAVRK